MIRIGRASASLALALASIAAAALIGPRTATAFGTINGMGQSAEHEKITRAAMADLEPATLDELAGKRGTFGAVGAPDNPATGQLFMPSMHCDNGDFLIGGRYRRQQEDGWQALTACRQMIVINLRAAVLVAGPLANPTPENTALDCVYTGAGANLSAKCEVLESLGAAFHTTQDFYSHSNWTDKAAPGAVSIDNPPGLGRTGRAPWLDPRRESPFPSGLITGCYEPTGCGGRITHDTLNKDKGTIGPSGPVGPGRTPRGMINGNFERAAAAAIEDTRDKWAFVQAAILTEYGEEKGRRILCVIRSDDYRKCVTPPNRTCPAVGTPEPGPAYPKVVFRQRSLLPPRTVTVIRRLENSPETYTASVTISPYINPRGEWITPHGGTVNVVWFSGASQVSRYFTVTHVDGDPRLRPGYLDYPEQGVRCVRMFFDNGVVLWHDPGTVSYSPFDLPPGANRVKRIELDYGQQKSPRTVAWDF